MSLSQEYLLKRLKYDPDTGIFVWRLREVFVAHDRQWNSKHAGKKAGWIKKGRYGSKYLNLKLDGKIYLSHRLAFLYMVGKFPPDGVDHIDRNGINNRWNNLRQANQTQNCANRSIHANNLSGFKGVSFHRRGNCYQADIRISGKKKYLGSFRTPEAAHEAYAVAAHKLFGEFARTV